jgi:hypothetical protein
MSKPDGGYAGLVALNLEEKCHRGGGRMFKPKREILLRSLILDDDHEIYRIVQKIGFSWKVIRDMGPDPEFHEKCT